MAIFNTADTTNMSGITAFSINTAETDGATGINEVSYIPDWTKWNGYYRTLDILNAIVDTKARWTVGDSYEAEKSVKEKLDKIKGFGKDNFNSIIFNQLRTALICGDSFAEVIRDKAGRLINLKPLNPGSMEIIVDKFGILNRFEQNSQVGKKVKIIFQPKEIFYLSNNRLADEIHGRSEFEKVEDIVLKLKELIADNAKIIHRYIKPLTIWSVKTDDDTEIQRFKTKVDHAFENCENLIVPDETVAGHDNISTPQAQILDPLPFINSLKTDITKALGVPDIILGWSGGATEASSKIEYLSFEQMIKFYQKWLEEQLEEQIGIKVNFVAPTSLDPAQTGNNKVQSLSSDQKKDAGQTKELNVNPNKDG
ncbi:phage portal protein [Candidatus Dojkabacteria bacterium]|jgi:hypothetical protein|nr:phage portal protein [Candidatus Dojkabacteria bacterium]